jgi:hypothetical protein
MKLERKIKKKKMLELSCLSLFLGELDDYNLLSAENITSGFL